MKYRKRPVVVEAVQYINTTDGVADVLRFVQLPLEPPDAIVGLFNDHLTIRTLEGTMRANPLDWIICGVKGEYYPCKPYICDATYELA